MLAFPAARQPVTKADIAIHEGIELDPRMDERDVFISHASEDKDEVARPLAEGLRGAGLSVWFDEYELTVGDSLRAKIDEGLNASRFGVVILSRSFFAKEWPQRELDGLLALEKGEKKILPVWHKIEEKEVAAFSPILAGRFATRTSGSLERVLDDLLKAIRQRTDGQDRGPNIKPPRSFRQSSGYMPLDHLGVLWLRDPNDHERVTGPYCTSPTNQAHLHYDGRDCDDEDLVGVLPLVCPDCGKSYFLGGTADRQKKVGDARKEARQAFSGGHDAQGRDSCGYGGVWFGNKFVLDDPSLVCDFGSDWLESGARKETTLDGEAVYHETVPIGPPNALLRIRYKVRMGEMAVGRVGANVQTPLRQSGVDESGEEEIPSDGHGRIDVVVKPQSSGTFLRARVYLLGWTIP